MTTCKTCNGLGRVSLPNPNWTPETPREATPSTGCHGRPLRTCETCQGTGHRD